MWAARTVALAGPEALSLVEAVSCRIVGDFSGYTRFEQALGTYFTHTVPSPSECGPSHDLVT
jgi:hypothetical protein